MRNTIDFLRQDLAYAVRVLRRSPGFALTAILVIALGIAATTAAFSVTDFVLIRPLPFPESERLVKVWERDPGYDRMELSPANYRDWTEAAVSFSSIGFYHPNSANLTGTSEPLHLVGASVSADLFPTLGVQPLLGRGFVERDDRKGAPGTLILSYTLWQTEFGGERDVVGRQVLLDGMPHTIIGVMPRSFNFPKSETQYWDTTRFDESNYQDRNDNWLESVGRLRPGATVEQARAEMSVLAARSREQYPAENKNTDATVITLRDEVSQQSRLLLNALSGASACLLLIACANLANLLLARALGRRRELAVRAAVGASRLRIIRQLMTESLLIAIVGGTLGVAVAIIAVPLLAKLVPTTLPIATEPSIDLRVLLMATGVTALTGFVFGLVPVVRGGDGASFDGLREGSRAGAGQKEGLRSALVVAEIGASVVLLVAAGLLIKALAAVQSTDPGFKPDGVLTMRTPLPLPQYDAVSTRDSFYTRVLTGVRALPGVTSAAYVSFLPIATGGGIWPVSVDGEMTTRANINQNASLRYVTPGYFATMGIPLRRGRDIEEGDGRGKRVVAVVSESLVQRYWPNLDPIGRHFKFAEDDREIVGVVGNVRVRGLERQSEPQIYLPYKQVADGAIVGYVPRDLAVRSVSVPTALAPAVRAIINNVDPKMPVTSVRTLADIVETSSASRSVQVRVLGAFALAAFVLAGIGIHGLLSFSVAQRTPEIGVRLALGAQSSDILSLVLQRTATVAVAGIVPGVAVAYAIGRWMEALLAGVKPADVPTLTSAVILSVVMTVAGSLVPTIRALRVDPIKTLRAE
ncbi:MAG TPA: ABC transporter permease [Vicinamibacterales bacterium]|nr:ABC transporter permease [Vicinamibacterales bacterium]